MTRGARRDWVRITISYNASETVAVRDVEDPWYAAGCYEHPTQHGVARIRLATAELREWLQGADRPPGSYVITVSELATHSVRDVVPEPTGVLWARVAVTQRASRPAASVATGPSALGAASKDAAA